MFAALAAALPSLAQGAGGAMGGGGGMSSSSASLNLSGMSIGSGGRKTSDIPAFLKTQWQGTTVAEQSPVIKWGLPLAALALLAFAVAKKG